MADLKPCPFCGGTEITASDFGVNCGTCLVQVAEISAGDVEAWNRRPSPWQPIETAPKGQQDGEGFDIWAVNGFGKGRRLTRCHWARGIEDPRYPRPEGWHSMDLNYYDGDHLSAEGFTATHWTPAPKPPET